MRSLSDPKQPHTVEDSMDLGTTPGSLTRVNSVLRLADAGRCAKLLPKPNKTVTGTKKKYNRCYRTKNVTGSLKHCYRAHNRCYRARNRCYRSVTPLSPLGNTIRPSVATLHSLARGGRWAGANTPSPAQHGHRHGTRFARPRP